MCRDFPLSVDANRCVAGRCGTPAQLCLGTPQASAQVCSDANLCDNAGNCSLPKRALGAACTSGAECAQGSCVEAVCRNSSCNGVCSTCAGTGICRAPPADSRCATGLCASAGVCQPPSVGTTSSGPGNPLALQHVESPECAWIGYIPCEDCNGGTERGHQPMAAVPHLDARGEDDPGAVRAALGFYRGVVDRRQPFVLVIDSRGGTAPSARQRQDIARRMKRWSRQHPGGMAGLAVVLTSAVDRGVFTAVSWAATNTFPMRAFSTPQEAEAWLREQL